jgi:hypothetical protein
MNPVEMCSFDKILSCHECVCVCVLSTGIYHLSMVCLMVPLSLLARFNYHRTADGSHVAGDTLTSPVAEPDNNHVTYNKDNDVTTDGHQSEQKLANDSILPTDVALSFENPGLVINEPKSSLDDGVE